MPIRKSLRKLKSLETPPRDCNLRERPYTDATEDTLGGISRLFRLELLRFYTCPAPLSNSFTNSKRTLFLQFDLPSHTPPTQAAVNGGAAIGNTRLAHWQQANRIHDKL